MAPKDLNAFLTFVCAGELRINFVDLILAQKSVEQLSIAKSYSIALYNKISTENRRLSTQ